MLHAMSILLRPLLGTLAGCALAAPFLAAHDGEGLPADVPFRSLTEMRFLKTGDPLVDWNPRRIWTSGDGRTLRGRILAMEQDAIRLQPENGNPVTIPLDRLSEDDRVFASEWSAVSEYFNLGYEPSRNLQGIIEAGIFDGAFAKAGKVHETRNFRFECDAELHQEVVKDFSRLFEATYAAVAAHPLGIAVARPAGGKFLVRLFATKSGYYGAGGSEDAAGVYLIKDRVMLVPLESLGLTPGSNGFRKTRDFDPRTLIHETTHALTHQWLAQAPMWFVEGFAEYISAIPYENGRLDLNRHREGLADLASKKFGGDANRFSLSRPVEFARIGHRAFMGEPEPAEQAIVLPRIEPFRISLVSPDKNTAGDPEPVASGSSPQPASPSSNPMEAPKPGMLLPGIETGGMLPRPSPDGREVVVRYVSSMTLIHHLVSTGQTDALRRYLFAFARFEWDLATYLHRFESSYQDHRDSVESQIRAFDAELKTFNAAAEAYNEAVKRYNRGETTSVPELPREPSIPKALEVPEILANPRNPGDLSRNRFLEEALGVYLDVPDSLSVSLLR